MWPRYRPPAMLTAVDHIVVQVSDLESAVDTYRRLGFTVTHPISDGVAYTDFGSFHLEFRVLADRSSTEGLHTLALRTDDIGAEVARLRSVGVPVSDPVDDLRGRLPRRTAEVESLIPIRLVEHHTADRRRQELIVVELEVRRFGECLHHRDDVLIGDRLFRSLHDRWDGEPFGCPRLLDIERREVAYEVHRLVVAIEGTPVTAG